VYFKEDLQNFHILLQFIDGYRKTQKHNKQNVSFTRIMMYDNDLKNI